MASGSLLACGITMHGGTENPQRTGKNESVCVCAVCAVCGLGTRHTAEC